MPAILNFRIFAKNGKTRICFYLFNRVTQSDFVEIFDPQGIRAMYSWQFQKIFPSPKMATILNFRIFAKNGKTRICFYLLTVRDRAISLKLSSNRLSDQCIFGNFQKKFPLSKNGGLFEFSNFSQKWQNTKLLLSP